MNNTRSITFIILSICILAAGIFGMYSLRTYVSNYSARVVEINTKLQTLEDAKNKSALYRKILSKGSKEQAQIDSYILSGDAVFKAITDLETDGKKSGFFSSDALGIASVRKRENVDLTPFGAGEVVVDIIAEGKKADMDAYIHALSNLPYVSHIENVSLQFSEKERTQAHIILVITEIL